MATCSVAIGPEEAAGMHEQHAANDAASVAARGPVVIIDEPDNTSTSPTPHGKMAAYKPRSSAPLQCSLPSYMQSIYEAERGRTLKRKYSDDSGCYTSVSPEHIVERSVSRGRTRKRGEPSRNTAYNYNTPGNLDDDADEDVRDNFWHKFFRIADMPDLPPAPVLPRPKSQSASNSPVRDQLQQLGLARPSIKFMRDDITSQSDQVLKLLDTLDDAGTNAFVNAGIRAGMDPTEQRSLRNCNSSAFDSTFPNTDVDGLVDVLKGLLVSAKKNQVENKDEAAWHGTTSRVLQAVIELEVNTPRAEALEIVDMRYTGVKAEFLPTAAPDFRKRIPQKKIDIALGWENSSELVTSLRSSLPPVETPLNASSGTKQPLQCGIEVKGPNGKYDEGQLQLATFHAAAIGHMLAHKKEGPPPLQVGWVVHRHHWQFHVSEWDEEAKAVHFIEWIPDLRMGTESGISLLRLIAVLRVLVRWLLAEYWESYASVLAEAEAQ